MTSASLGRGICLSSRLWGHSLLKSLARTLTQGRVIHLVIDLVDILRQAGSKAFQGPDRQPFRVNLTGHMPGRFAGLGVSSQLVEQLRCCCTKKPFHDRPETRLLWRTIELRDQTAGQQGLKVDTSKLRPLIHHEFLGESPVPLNTQPKGHHGGAVAWGIKCHIASQHPSAVGIGHERGPRSGQRLSRHRGDQNQIQFRMIEMCSLKRTISVSWGELV
jgi:hypothetical protein